MAIALRRAAPAVAVLVAIALVGVAALKLFGGQSIGARQALLRKTPFTQSFAPRGYRLRQFGSIFDGKETLGAEATFAGPDEGDSISFYTQAMSAKGVYDYWRRDLELFGKTVLPVAPLGSRTFCDEGDDVFGERHVVSCTAALDGMAVIAESANRKPQRGSLDHATALLRAGVRYWNSIRE